MLTFLLCWCCRHSLVWNCVCRHTRKPIILKGYVKVCHGMWVDTTAAGSHISGLVTVCVLCGTVSETVHVAVFDCGVLQPLASACGLVKA